MSDKQASQPTYEVGYGKPPKHSQFKPGQSGNPKGRGNGVRNLRTDVIEALKRPILITENGKRKKISTQDGSLRMLAQKALRGDVRALVQLLDLSAKYNNEPPPPSAAEPLSAGDEEIIAEALRRYKGAGRGANRQVMGPRGAKAGGAGPTASSADAASPKRKARRSTKVSDSAKPDDPSPARRRKRK